MQKQSILIAILFVFFFGCISLCPSTCDDSNPCTKDFCSMDTGFRCTHSKLNGSQAGCDSLVPPCRMQTCEAGSCKIRNISNCCGNGICETNEDISNCAADCASAIKLTCNATSPLVPILLKLEKELDTEFIYCTMTNTGTTRRDVVFIAEVPGWSNNFSKSMELFPGISKEVSVKLDWKDKFYKNKESADASINFKVESSGVTVASETRNVKISPKEDIFWSVTADGEKVQLYHSIAAWVTPHDTCISSLISNAKELAPGRSLGGYANYQGLTSEEKANRTIEQARAIFYAIKGQGISYVNTPVSFSGSQRVKMPADSLVEKSGNCVDGSVLFASAFEALGMNPVIVIIPQHTFVGVETYPKSNRYAFIETTMVGSSSFESALNEGSRQYNDYKDKDSMSVIDIVSHRSNITPFQSYTTCALNLSCSDGTPAGTCSSKKPKLCTGAALVDAASVCGCPDEYYASGDKCFSSILKNETFVLGTASHDELYFWGPNFKPGTFVTYRYVIKSSQPIQVYFVPSKEDYDKRKAGMSFMHYPVYMGTNTLSYDQKVTHASNGGVMLLNDGKEKATVEIKVFYEPG